VKRLEGGEGEGPGFFFDRKFPWLQAANNQKIPKPDIPPLALKMFAPVCVRLKCNLL